MIIITKQDLTEQIMLSLSAILDDKKYSISMLATKISNEIEIASNNINNNKVRRS